MRFDDIIGQQELKTFLRSNIDSGRVAHAQLFEGDCGYGTLAMSIAYVQYLNCMNKVHGDSCGHCSSCKKIASLQHPDLHFVFPVNKTDKAINLSKTLPAISDNFIDSWRDCFLNSTPQGYFSEGDWYEAIELKSKTLHPIINKREADKILEKLILKPVESKYVTVIIWMPEKMNDAAANTLLKQFEEPIANALFIFVAQDSSKIIKTILSRIQLVNVPPIDRGSIANFLATHYPSNTEQEVISRICKGSLIRAVQYATSDQEQEDKSFEVFKSLMRFCYQNKHMELMGWVDTFGELTKEQIDDFFTSSIEILRCSFMENIGLSELNNSYREKREFIDKFYPFISSENIEHLIKEFELASFHLLRSGYQKIVMTHFALTITKLIKKR